MEAKKEMTEYRNTIHLGDFMSNGLPDHCCDLIIADPPYYRVKGDFDQVWETFGDYLKDVERWAAELARLMSYNGTLVWFGSHRSIAYIQVILDRSFHLLNNCTILKTNSIQKVLASPEAQRSFFSNDERFLIYESNSEDKDESLGGKAKNYYNTRLGLLHSRCVKPVIDYMNEERERAGFTVTQINKSLGTSMASHWFTYKSQFELPTPEWYGRLRDLFNGRGGEFLRKDYEFLRKDYEFLRKDYEELRKDYEELRKDYEELRKDYEELRKDYHGRQADGCVLRDMGLRRIKSAGTSDREGHQADAHSHPFTLTPRADGAGAIHGKRERMSRGQRTRTELYRL